MYFWNYMDVVFNYYRPWSNSVQINTNISELLAYIIGKFMPIAFARANLFVCAKFSAYVHTTCVILWLGVEKVSQLLPFITTMNQYFGQVIEN